MDTMFIVLNTSLMKDNVMSVILLMNIQLFRGTFSEKKAPKCKRHDRNVVWVNSLDFCILA